MPSTGVVLSHHANRLPKLALPFESPGLHPWARECLAVSTPCEREVMVPLPDAGQLPNVDLYFQAHSPHLLRETQRWMPGVVVL